MLTSSAAITIAGKILGIAVPLILAVLIRRRHRRRQGQTPTPLTHLDRQPDSGRTPIMPAPHGGDVIFVVSNDPWIYRPMQVFARALLIGGVGVVAWWILAWPLPQPDSGIYLAMAGFLLIMGTAGSIQGNSFARTRIEGTPECLWVWTTTGPPRRVLPQDIGAIKKLFFDSYGGIDVRDHTGKRIFRVQRVAEGFDDLVAFLRVSRPDLPMPI